MKAAIVPLLLLLMVGPRPALARETSVKSTCVQVFSAPRSIDLSFPWKRGTPRGASGSGVWLGGGRVLTNAHVVVYSSQISVQPYESSEKVAAKVVGLAPEMDLAVLELEPTNLFADAPVLPIAESLPKLGTQLEILGYPTGGTTQSITEGTVARIEYTAYLYQARGLRIQIDAGVNPGNSGGPAIHDGKLVGVVFSRLQAGDNIGYLIPCTEIRDFLTDIADGSYSGKLQILDEMQNLQNESLRRRLRIPAEATGVLVRRPQLMDADYPLKAGDVITHIGPHAIDNTGMLRLEADVRVLLHHVVDAEAKDGRVRATVLRGGQKHDVEVPVAHERDLVIPYLKGRQPSYFVYGPLVFTPAVGDYLDGIEQAGVNGVKLARSLAQRESPLVLRRFDKPQFPGEQIVMVAAILPHRVHAGYANLPSVVLRSVNGQKIQNMTHLVRTLRNLTDRDVAFDFADHAAETIVYDREAVLASCDEILAENAIPKACSPDLAEAWGDGKPES